jgi:hypothetical protein
LGRRGLRGGRLVQEPEVHFNGGGYRYRFAVLLARLEAPLAHRFDRLLIETQTERAQDPYVPRHSIRLDLRV